MVKVKIKKITKIILIFLLLLLPLHHLSVYSVNLTHIKDESPYKEKIWFNNDSSPDKTLEGYIEIVKKEDLKLHIVYPRDLEFGYVYNWIYSAVAGKCYWENLNCHKIFGFDINQGKFIELNTQSVNYTY